MNAALGDAFDEAEALLLTRFGEVHAAGDITRGAHTVTWASADGVMAGVAVPRELVFGD